MVLVTQPDENSVGYIHQLLKDLVKVEWVIHRVLDDLEKAQQVMCQMDEGQAKE